MKSAEWLTPTFGEFLAKKRKKMKTKPIGIVLIIAFILASCTPASTPTPEIIQQSVSEVQHVKVGLDPGHGWGDSKTGAIGNGLIEKDVNLEIALLTKQILEDNGIEVVLTREEDSYDKKLYQAAEIMNHESPTLVVSIHTNSGGSTASGTEACYTAGKNTDEQSKQLAQLLTESVARSLSVKNRGIFPENSEGVCGRGRGRLYIHDMNPPSAIIETGFLSNPAEAEFLKSRKSEYAQAIAQAIMNYLGIQNLLISAPGSTTAPTINITIESATLSSNEQSRNGLIAYIRGGNILLYDLSTMDEIQLTTDSNYSMPSISINGKFVAFVKFSGAPKQYSIGLIEILTGKEETIIYPQKVGTVIGNYYTFYNLQWVNDDTELYFNTTDGRVAGDDTWDYSFSDGTIISGRFIGYRNLRVSPDGSKYVYVNWANALPSENGLTLYNFTKADETTLMPRTNDLHIVDLCWINNENLLVIESRNSNNYHKIAAFNVANGNGYTLFESGEEIDSLGCANSINLFAYESNERIYLFNGESSQLISNGNEPSIWIKESILH